MVMSTSAATPGSQRTDQRNLARWGRRAVIERIAAVAASLTLAPALASRPVAAASGSCVNDSEPIQRRPVAPATLAANVPDPFGYRPDATDRAAVLREVRDIVRDQAAEMGVEACYLEKPAQIVQRIQFLSPFEFLVSSLYEQDPTRRDGLLDRYAADSDGALREIAPIAPSPRSQMTLATYAYYDIDADRVLVNVAHVPSAELRRVLVHEAWHAMPRIATWSDTGGGSFRASGFWTQEKRSGPRAWMPVENRGDLPFEAYLLNEAMATLMETRYAGPSRFAQKDVEQVRRFTEHLMQVSGPAEVLRPYLESRPAGLVALVDQHRASLPEIQPIAHP